MARTIRTRDGGDNHKMIELFEKGDRVIIKTNTVEKEVICVTSLKNASGSDCR